MKLRIKCPGCGYGQIKDVLGSAPAGPQDISCPVCKHEFKFRIPSSNSGKPDIPDFLNDIFSGFGKSK